MYGDSSDDDDDDDDDDDGDDYHGIATTTTTAAAMFSRTTATTRTAATIAAAAAAAASANDKRIRKLTKTKKTQTTKRKKKRRMEKDWKNPNNIFVKELTSSSTLMMKKIGLGFVVLVFVANFIILSVYLPPPSATNSDPSKLRIISIRRRSSRRSFTSSVFPGSGSISANNNNNNRNLPPCGDDDGVHPVSWSSWGCTIFPPEYTNDYNNTMRSKWSKSSTVDSSSSSSTSGYYTFASLTEQGKSHKVNQDRGFVVTQFMNVLANEDDGENNNEDNAIHSQQNFVMGVFDGHGQYGHNVSQRCVETFPKLLHDKLVLLLQRQQDESIARTTTATTTTTTTEATIKQILNETFWELDRQGTSPEYYMGGTTATVALRLFGEDKLYVANTGDSQTIVVQCTAANLGGGRSGNNRNNSSNNNNINVKAEVVYKSIKDKPNLADEHDRILGRGGVIGPNGGRVIVHTKAVQKDIIGLAMSRSIGDWEWGDVGVIPEPRVDVIDLKPYYQDMTSTSKLKDDTTKTTSTTASTLFVMSASDGIWDRRPRPDFFARQFCPTFVGDDEMMKNSHTTQNSLVFQRKLMDVMDLVTPTVGYQDDMTAVIMKLDL